MEKLMIRKIIFILIAVILLSCSSLSAEKSTIIITDRTYLLPDVKINIIFQDGTEKTGKTNKNGKINIKLKESDDFTIIVYRNTLFYSDKKWRKISILQNTKINFNEFKHVDIDYYPSVEEFEFRLIAGENYFLNFKRSSAQISD